MCKKRAAQIFALIMLGLSIMGAGIQENPPEPKGSTPAHEMETEITISQEKRKEQKKETALDGISDFSIYDPYEVNGSDLAKSAKNSAGRSGYTVCYVDAEAHESDITQWPQGLIEYIKEGLNENVLDEYLLAISAEYRKIEDREKDELIHGELGIEYFAPLYDEDDIWYLVSLTEWGDDLVICRQLEEGYELTYIFLNYMNCGYGEPPYTGGGQKNSTPYFIQWEGVNYIVFPYWNRAENRIVGAAVYLHTGGYGDAVTIGRNSDGTFQVIYQEAWSMTPGREWQIGEYSQEVPWIEVY